MCRGCCLAYGRQQHDGREDTMFQLPDDPHQISSSLAHIVVGKTANPMYMYQINGRQH